MHIQRLVSFRCALYIFIHAKLLSYETVYIIKHYYSSKQSSVCMFLVIQRAGRGPTLWANSYCLSIRFWFVKVHTGFHVASSIAWNVFLFSEDICYHTPLFSAVTVFVLCRRLMDVHWDVQWTSSLQAAKWPPARCYDRVEFDLLYLLLYLCDRLPCLVTVAEDVLFRRPSCLKIQICDGLLQLSISLNQHATLTVTSQQCLRRSPSHSLTSPSIYHKQQVLTCLQAWWGAPCARNGSQVCACGQQPTLLVVDLNSRSNGRPQRASACSLLMYVLFVTVFVRGCCFAEPRKSPAPAVHVLEPLTVAATPALAPVSATRSSRKRPTRPSSRETVNEDTSDGGMAASGGLDAATIAYERR